MSARVPTGSPWPPPNCRFLRKVVFFGIRLGLGGDELRLREALWARRGPFVFVCLLIVLLGPLPLAVGFGLSSSFSLGLGLLGRDVLRNETEEDIDFMFPSGAGRAGEGGRKEESGAGAGPAEFNGACLGMMMSVSVTGMGR